MRRILFVHDEANHEHTAYFHGSNDLVKAETSVKLVSILEERYNLDMANAETVCQPLENDSTIYYLMDVPTHK